MTINSNKIDHLSIWVIFIITGVVCIGGVLQLHSYLFIHQRTAFEALTERLDEIQNQADSEVLSDSAAAQDLAQLQNQDSDNDGLTDFEERYVHNTSAYLADSDSDQISDKDEIANNTNPNCPEGTECTEQRSETGDGTTDSGNGGTAANPNTNAEQAFSDFNASDLLTVDENGNVDTKELRKTLEKYGVPADVINKMTDDELVQAFQETVNQTKSGSNASASVQQYADTLRAMSEDEKRNFLIESGVAKTEVDKLDKASLDALFDQVVNQALEEQGLVKTPTEGTDDNANTDTNAAENQKKEDSSGDTNTNTNENKQ